MAIQTLTSDSLAEVAANKQALSGITNGDDVTAAVISRSSPVVGTGTERSPDAPPEPQGDVQAERKGAKNDVQSRINELTRLRKEAEEFAEDEYNNRLRAERRIGELEEAIKTTQPTQPVAAVQAKDELKEPSEADFTDIGSFTRAWSEYTLKLADRRAAEARNQERALMAAEAENAELAKRVAVAKDEFDDFDKVIGASRNKQIPQHIELAIRESEYGPHLAYHLAKNPDDESRILALTPARALLELGKIENQYAARRVKVTSTTETTRQQPQIETTRAPAPVSSIKAEAGSVPSSSSEARNFNEYRRIRQEELRRNRR